MRPSDGRHGHLLNSTAIQIVIVEGVSREGELHRVQRAFVEHDAFQCAYCTPGFALSAIALLDENPSPGDEDVRDYLAGNLCRCGSYPNILRAMAALGTSSHTAQRP